MNLGDIKAFIENKTPNRVPNQDVRTQLQENGLKQAAATQASYVSLSTSVSSTTVGLRVLSGSLNQSVTLNDVKPNIPVPKKPSNEGLFDFEEVAKNVLNFIGGAVKSAKANGMEDEELLGMFEKARDGVLKGIEMARKDLAGFMNDEIDEGINKSQDLIEKGIRDLEAEIFGLPQTEEETLIVGASSVSYEREDSGEIQITTQDGDEVTIRFEDIQEFEYNRGILVSNSQVEPAEISQQQPNDTPEDESSEPQASNQSNQVIAENVGEDAETPDEVTQTQVVVDERYEFFEQSGISFSVQGELDEEELQAISDLVSDTKELADEFFNGNVEDAYQQALELGFNEQEIAGYALQLNRTEQIEVIQTYAAVSRYEEDNESSIEGKGPLAAIKPVADYLEEMLAVMEQAREQLRDGSDFESLLNGLVNKVIDVDANDLVDAINRLQSFNQQLLDSLPLDVDSTQVTESGNVATRQQESE